LGAETALRTETGGEVILAGAMMDRVTGATTYSGLTRSSRLRGWKLRRQEPHPNKCISCETLNGNLVLIPRAVADKVGNIDPHYVHNLADIDYGFRARRFGISLWLIPGYAGYCAPNTSRPSWKRAGLTLTERIKLINSPLGIPVRANFEYAIGHFGVAGPWVFSEPYLSLLLSHFRRAGGPKS
jgi:GT2 family glycosyltransferase